MTPRVAIRILMLSPIYFQLSPVQRWYLIREYCQLVNEYEMNSIQQMNSGSK